MEAYIFKVIFIIVIIFFLFFRELVLSSASELSLVSHLEPRRRHLSALLLLRGRKLR